MSRTALRLDLPSGSWLGDASRAVPSATLRVTETIAVDDDADRSTTAATVLVTGTARDRVAAALRDHDGVDRAATVERRGEARTLRVVGRTPPSLAAARAAALPLDSAIEATDGRALVTVAGERERVEAFGRRLTAAGVTVGVAATSDDDGDRTLTEAQRELVLDAVRRGYYDTPRGCTLTELAEANGIAKSTCSETLHRAEGRVLRRFVDGEIDAARTESGGDGSTDPAAAEASDATGEPLGASGAEGDDALSAATEP